MIPTTRRTTDYRLKNTIFRVTYGDITQQIVDAIVSSDDSFLSMSGGVSRSILNAGGKIIQMDTRKQVPINIGDVAVTSAGEITAKYIFHAVTIDYANMIYSSEESIRVATLKCMQLADTLNVRTIAFPALGTGVGGFPFQLAAEVMTRTIADYLINETRIELVLLTLFENDRARESDLNLFYEKSVACASIYAQSKRLSSLMVELKGIVNRVNKPFLSEWIKKLEDELIQAQSHFTEEQTNVEHPKQISNYDELRDVSEGIINISPEIQNTIIWADKQLEFAVLKTKLEGLLTLLNIQNANLYRLKIQKAKHGLDVPLYLENAIDELKIEILKTEASVKEIKEQLELLYIRGS